MCFVYLFLTTIFDICSEFIEKITDSSYGIGCERVVCDINSIAGIRCAEERANPSKSIADRITIGVRIEKIREVYGKNALLMFILHPIFIGLAMLYMNDETLAILVVLGALLNVIVLWSAAWVLDKKEIYIII